MQPDLIACLVCRFPRTLRMGTRRVCFQCRSNWAFDELSLELFNPRERHRLRAYRDAVRVGFYSEFEVGWSRHGLSAEPAP